MDDDEELNNRINCVNETGLNGELKRPLLYIVQKDTYNWGFGIRNLITLIQKTSNNHNNPYSRKPVSVNKLR